MGLDLDEKNRLVSPKLEVDLWVLKVKLLGGFAFVFVDADVDDGVDDGIDCNGGDTEGEDAPEEDNGMEMKEIGEDRWLGEEEEEVQEEQEVLEEKVEVEEEEGKED